VCAQYVPGLGEHIFDKCPGHDPQGDLAVDSAEGEVVDLIAKRRNVGALTGVHVDHQHVFAVEIQLRGEVKGEGRVSALVLAEARPV